MRGFLLLLLALPGLALGAPFVVADVVAGVTSCNVVLDGGAKVNVPATTVAPLQCKYDLTAALATGAHTVTMTAVAVGDPVFGTQESVPSSPFSFTKPAAPAVPTSLRLTP